MIRINLKHFGISDISATKDLIKAGDCLFAADSTGITAVKIKDQ